MGFHTTRCLHFVHLALRRWYNVCLWPWHTAVGALVMLHRSPPFFLGRCFSGSCTGHLLGTVVLQNWFNKDLAILGSLCWNAARLLDACNMKFNCKFFIITHWFQRKNHLISLAGSSFFMPGSGIDIPLWELTGKMETSTSCSIRSSAGEKPGIFTPHLPKARSTGDVFHVQTGSRNHEKWPKKLWVHENISCEQAILMSCEWNNR